jgi:hypothetical protein
MELEFSGEIWYWRGPAPHYFVTVPERQSDDIRAVAKLVTYGWGVIPVTVQIGGTRWTTSLFPKNGGYIVPIKMIARKAEDLKEGDTVSIRLELTLRPG